MYQPGKVIIVAVALSAISLAMINWRHTARYISVVRGAASNYEMSPCIYFVLWWAFVLAANEWGL